MFRSLLLLVAAILIMGLAHCGTSHAERKGDPNLKSNDQMLDDELRKAEQQGKTPEQYARELLKQSKPVRRTDKELRSAAFSTAGIIMLQKSCKVPLTYAEKVEVIVTGTQVGLRRIDEALAELDERMQQFGASEFCLRLEKGVRGKVEW